MIVCGWNNLQHFSVEETWITDIQIYELRQIIEIDLNLKHPKNQPPTSSNCFQEHINFTIIVVELHITNDGDSYWKVCGLFTKGE